MYSQYPEDKSAEPYSQLAAAIQDMQSNPND